MEKYTIYCTEEQTKKALELGAPIRNIPMFMYDESNTPKYIHRNEYNREVFSCCPTAEEMIGWLEEQGIWIHFYKPNHRSKLLSFSVSNINEPLISVFIGGEYSSRTETVIAAIDSALDYLASKKGGKE